MANYIAGTVTWKLEADDTAFLAALARARKEIGNIESQVKVTRNSFSDFASDAGGAFGNIADKLGGLLKGITAVGVGSSIGFGAAIKSSFDMARQVENATFALKAYTGSATKAGNITADLVKFAQSDTGVLFQRGDLLDAASALAVYGANADKITGFVKIMSKGVALGTTNFQELSQILGRVGAAGKLTGVDFDVLTARGLRLPSTMRNAAVSFDELFQAVNNAIPDGVLEGRADSIDGRLIRLKSSFRNLGNEILGVTTVQDGFGNSVTKFAEGGLGDKFLKLLDSLKETLGSPEIKNAFRDLGKSLGNFADKAVPVLIRTLRFLLTNQDTVIAAISGIGVAFVGAKLAAIGFSIAASANPVGLIAAAIVGLIAALTFLQVKYQIFTQGLMALKPIIDPIISIFSTLFTLLGQQLAPVIDFVSRNMDIFKKILVVLMAFGLAPLVFSLGLVFGILAAGISIVTGAIFVFRQLAEAVIAVGGFLIGVFGNILNGAFNILGQVVGFFARLPGSIIGAIGDLGSILYNAGRDMIQGLLNGAGSLLKDIGKFMASKLPSAIREPFKRALGINSPSKVFAGFGQNITEGLVQGIEQSQSMLTGAMDGLSTNIAGPQLATNISSGSNNDGTLLGRVEQSNTFNVYNNVDLTQGLRDIAWQLGN